MTIVWLSHFLFVSLQSKKLNNMHVLTDEEIWLLWLGVFAILVMLYLAHDGDDSYPQ